MKYFVTFIIVLLFSFEGFSQPAVYTSTMDALTEHFNKGEFEEIFNQFSSEMKVTLPLRETKQFFTEVLNQAGRIDSSEFKGFTRGSYATYKTDFDRMQLSVNISVNDEEKINGLFVEPYEEGETESQGVVNELTGVPEAIDSLIFQKIKYFPDTTELAIAVIDKGEPQYYGTIKENDTIKSMTNKDAVFEIGSLTKVFTASVLATLVEQRMLKLEDPINPFFPFKFHKGFPLSFERLANHTSGLPPLPSNFDFSNQENPYKNYDADALNTFLSDSLRIDSRDPGYAYSNLGFGLLGYSLELATHTPFKKLLQNRILDKLQMKETYLDNKRIANLVKGRDQNGDIALNWDFQVLFGSGGMLSTVRDLTKFIEAQFEPEYRAFALTRKITHRVSDDLGIGLGWHITRSVDHDDLYWVNGGTGGYRSTMVMDTRTKSGVIILSNVSALHPRNENIDKLALDLIKRLMAE